MFIDIVFNRPMVVIVALIILLVIYYFLYGFTWHIIPWVVLLTSYLIIIILKSINLSVGRFFKNNFVIFIGGILLISPMVLIWIFPTESVPLPTGSYDIGTTSIEIDNESRNEIYNDNQLYRKIKVQLWYPTDDITGKEKSNWMIDGIELTRHLASNMHLPSFMLDQTLDIKANAYVNAPMSIKETKFPVIIISHGWKGFRELHTDVAEELASHGYIVAAIDHTYGSQAVKFKDETLYLNENALPKSVGYKTFNRKGSVLINTFQDDIYEVLDQLKIINDKPGDFSGRFDLDLIGVLGHSTGGAGGIRASLNDTRIKTLVAMDPWVEPLKQSQLVQGLNQPTLILRSDQWSQGPNNQNLNFLINHSQNIDLVQLTKTKHIDFTMAYMFSPLTKLVGFNGRYGGRQSSQIQQDLIVSHYDHHLKQKTNNIDAILKQHQELQLIEIKDKND